MRGSSSKRNRRIQLLQMRDKVLSDIQNLSARSLWSTARSVPDKTSLKPSALLVGNFLSLQGLLHGKIDGNCQEYFFLPPSKCAEQILV